MLDIKFIRENPEKVKDGLAKKGVKFDVDYFLELDEKYRRKIKEVDDLRAEHKKASEDVAKTSEDERDKKIKDIRRQKEKLEAIEFEKKALEEEFKELMYKIPNLPLEDVPVGKDESENVVLREVGDKLKFGFAPKDYVELSGQLDLIDTDRAAKISGSRFGFLKNDGALLEFALVQFAYEFLTNEKNILSIIKKNNLSLPARAFVPIIPPVLIKPEVMRAMGYVERGQDEIYFIEKDNLYLVGTSEQSVGSMHTDEVLGEEGVPQRYIAFSTCFRREAGSYGKDTRGILRVHQFDKLEMFSFTAPEMSREEHKLFLGIEEYFMQALKIPYRVLNICTGDLGDPAAAKYDIEAWLPGQKNGKGEYRETHSTSNTIDFQMRRLNTKLRLKNGKTEFAHAVNGTAFAIGRTIIAILENYQQKDGSIIVPEVLRPYLGNREVINGLNGHA